MAMSGLEFSWAPGQEVEVEDGLAEALCAPVDGGEARASYVGVKPAARRTATRPKAESRG